MAGGGHAAQGKREPSAEMTDACWKPVMLDFKPERDSPFP